MIELGEGEKILADKAANAKKGLEFVGGRLAVTTKRVIHTPHKLNVQSEITEIPISDLKFVSTYNQFGILPTGIVIKSKNDAEYRFVVWGRMKLIETINSLI